jgi:low affinity Fe/Cu permease
MPDVSRTAQRVSRAVGTAIGAVLVAVVLIVAGLLVYASARWAITWAWGLAT